MDASQSNEWREPKRRHEGHSPIGDPPEQGIARAQMTDQKPGEQRPHAGAQRNSHASDRKLTSTPTTPPRKIASPSTMKSIVELGATHTPMVAAAFCTAGSGPTTRSK